MSDLIVDTSASLSFSQRYRIVNPLTLVFCDSGLEQEYQTNLATNIARQVRIALVLAFVLYLNFAFLDYLLVPELMWALWGIRAVTCSLLALLFFISFQPFFQRIHQQVIFTSSMVAATGIFAMLLITHNQYSHYYYAGINLCITWTLFIVGLRFMNALQTVCLIVLLYNCIAFYKHLPLVDIISNNFFLVSNAVIGIFAGYTIEQHSRWQFYQSLVIKINTQRTAEQEIARQREMLQRNEKLAAMGTLLAGISHELNNPLTIVVGQAQLLQEVEHDPRILKRADKIRQAAERCATIITTFLSMARNQPPTCASVDMNELIKHVLELLEPKLREHHIEMHLELGEHLPSVSVDADQVHQVISNLIINAQQAMQESPQKILRIASSVAADSSNLLIRIQDSGPGITPEVERRIFEPFFTTKAPGKGTGLGLAVCSGIVEAHGGRLELEPFTGEGACFRVSLPLHRA